MVSVKTLLLANGGRVIGVPPEETVFDAIRLMAEHGIGSLLVMREGRLLGIMSERDYTRKIALKDRSSKTTRVEEIMTAPVITVGSRQTVDDCMQLMSARHIRHLPVVDDGAVLGVVSILDVLRSMLNDKDFEIRQLENYIAGSA
jgi:CBS domain-containing protein